jgi:hypothetical protein
MLNGVVSGRLGRYEKDACHSTTKLGPGEYRLTSRSRGWKTCCHPSSSNRAETISRDLVHTVGNPPREIRFSLGNCTTWVTWFRDGRVNCRSPIRNITVPPAASTSTRTCRTWPHHMGITPTGLWRWRCSIAAPVGRSGVTIRCLSLLRSSRSGWRLGKKEPVTDPQGVNQAVWRAVAQVRKQLAAQQSQLKRGRPTPQQRPLVQKRHRLQQKITGLFAYRHLFVQRHLTAAE